MWRIDVDALVIRCAFFEDDLFPGEELREAILMLAGADRVVLLWETRRPPGRLYVPEEWT